MSKYRNYVKSVKIQDLGLKILVSPVRFLVVPHEKELSRDNSFLFYSESEFHRHNLVRRSATVKRLRDRSKRIELCSETPLSTAGEANIDLQFFIFGFNSYFCKIIYILET